MVFQNVTLDISPNIFPSGYEQAGLKDRGIQNAKKPGIINTTLYSSNSLNSMYATAFKFDTPGFTPETRNQSVVGINASLLELGTKSHNNARVITTTNLLTASAEGRLEGFEAGFALYKSELGVRIWGNEDGNLYVMGNVYGGGYYVGGSFSIAESGVTLPTPWGVGGGVGWKYVSNTKELFKNPWIQLDDKSFYESIGIDSK